MKRSVKSILAGVALGLTAATSLASIASATTPIQYNYSYTRGTTSTDGLAFGGYGTSIQTFSTSYINNTGLNDTLAFRVTMSGTTLTTINNDGFWMVLNDGPNIAGTGNLAEASKAAIIYGDVASRRLTVYQYDGTNSRNSFVSENASGAAPIIFNNALTTFTAGGQVGFQFNISVADINDVLKVNSTSLRWNVPSGWEGAAFGSQIGIWYHPIADLVTHYANNSRGQLTLTRFDGADGFFDTTRNTGLTTTPSCPAGTTGNPSTGCRPTTAVSEPNTLAVLGLGLAAVGLLARRRRKTA
jgi:hypothetical protein